MTPGELRRRCARRWLVSLHASVLLLAGCDGGTPLERGTRIFQRTCSPCHGSDGRKGSATVLGFNPPPRDLTDHDFQAQRTDDQLRRSIRLGKGQMPAFGGVFDDGDVSAVIVFIRSLDPRLLHNGAGGEAPAPASSGPALGLTGPAPMPLGVGEGAPR